ncbi:hypothetical protein [Bradyrhizobium sp. B039]|uniref:hypothetical protein n=1 Tax=Bradyrhizobium sp. B039 TaxID=3140239 RepID=UPI00318461FC
MVQHSTSGTTIGRATQYLNVGPGNFAQLGFINVTDEDANSAFEELMRALRERGLDWIADQVSRDIAEGQSVVTILTPEQAPKLGPFSVGRPRKTRARAAEFTRVLPYDAKSKLLKLITAIETTVASSAAIAEHLAGFVSAGQPFGIIFRGDEPEESSYRISEDDLVVTVPAGERLQHLLSELRNEVSGDSST